MKKKTIALALVLMMVFGITCGGTIAYLTAKTDAVVNTFTVGKVAITLDEAMVNAAGEKIDYNNDQKIDDKDRSAGKADGSALNSYKLMPGGSYTKDPTVAVSAGSEPAYVKAVVKTTGVNLQQTKLWVGDETAGYVGLFDVVSGGLTTKTGTVKKANVWDCGDYYLEQKKVSDTEWSFTYYFKAPKAENSKMVLFDTLTIPSDWENDDIKAIDGLNIKVTAYAIQAEGFKTVDNTDNEALIAAWAAAPADWQ